MPKNDTPLAHASDIPFAIGILSRLPIKVNQEAALKRGAAAAWAYPIVGAIVGFLGALTGWSALLLGLPNIVVAAVVLVTLIMTSGAMHEDGLADTFDGFWGGYTVERRLEIMKDSSIGTYGVLALVLSVLLRFSLILYLINVGALWTLVAVGALSRASIAVLMAKMKPARQVGLSHSVGRPRIETALLGVLIAVFIGFVIIGGTILHGVFLAGLAVGALAYVAQNKIGGQTGDVLGASQQLSEIAFLAAIVASTAT